MCAVTNVFVRMEAVSDADAGDEILAVGDTVPEVVDVELIVSERVNSSDGEFLDGVSVGVGVIEPRLGVTEVDMVTSSDELGVADRVPTVISKLGERD